MRTIALGSPLGMQQQSGRSKCSRGRPGQLRLNAAGPRSQLCINGLLLLFISFIPARAQELRVSSAILSNSTLKLSFPARSDSYYFLLSEPSLDSTWTPVTACLGTNGDQTFLGSVQGASVSFFRLQQLPLTGSNDQDNDGIPDAWELQHGLNPLLATDAAQSPLGDTRSWLQIYQAEASIAQLPLAYFPQTALTNVVGGSNVAIQVAFTKPFTGRLNFQLSGTAIPEKGDGNGDYYPTNYVDVVGATQAPIAVGLVPRSAVEVDRTLVVALSAPAAATGYRITNNTSVCVVRLAQSTQGIYLGTLDITNGLYMGSQSVKLAFRPAPGGATVAFFDVTGNPVLGDNFTVPATVGNMGFQPAGSYSRQLTNTPFGRPLNVNLAFGTAQHNATPSFMIPVTLNISGLTASGQAYMGAGNLTLTRAQ
jgi:hypothetical protein